ncbi:MAG: TetR/AcrR family transcriptional regulator C-terminal domain-containing protein [Acidimicrobiia bacterium]
MVTDITATKGTRAPLSKELVLRGAVAVADAEGIEALTMRRLAEHLGVEAMSLYYHVANKEAVLDGVAETLVDEIQEELGDLGTGVDASSWKSTLREVLLSARKVMLRHPWAPAVFETRTKMSPSIVLYFERLLGILREGGFSYDLAHHSMHALGSRALGFSHEMFQPESAEAEEEADEMFEHMLENLPYLAGMMMEIVHDDPDSTLGWCDDQTEFEFALDLVLDGLEQRLLVES